MCVSPDVKRAASHQQIASGRERTVGRAPFDANLAASFSLHAPVTIITNRWNRPMVGAEQDVLQSNDVPNARGTSASASTKDYAAMLRAATRVASIFPV